MRATLPAPSLSFRLGILMEELHVLEDMRGKVRAAQPAAGESNKEAKDSSKTEEIDAICQLHGVGGSAPLGNT